MSAGGRFKVKLCDPNRGGRAVDALLAVLFAALTLLIYRVTFLTNDDAVIANTLSGCYTGAPYFDNGFIGLPVGSLTALLYRLIPAVPWWGTLLLLGAVCGVYVLNRMVTRASAEAALPWFLPILLNTLLYWLVYVYAVARLSFTMTSCLIGCAGVACILTVPADQKLGRWGVRGVTLLLLCFFFRNSTGISMLCFFGAAIFWRVLYALIDSPGASRKPLIRSALIVALTGFVLCLGAVALNAWKESALNAPQYAAFEDARGRFFDFPHVTYADDPAFFASIGWDETIYNMAQSMCFFDARITAEAMNAVLAYPLEPVPLLQMLQEAFAHGEAFFRGNGAAQYLLVVPVLVTLWTIALRPRKRGEGRSALITALALAAGSFALCLFLCLKQRLILRAFQVVAIPAAVCLTRMLLCRAAYARRSEEPRNESSKKPLSRVLVRAGWLVLTALSAFFLLWSGYRTNAALAAYDPDESIRDMRAVRAYAIAHPENVYIYAPRLIYDVEAFQAYPDEKPTNLIDWGNTGAYTAWKEKQLTNNGLTTLNAAIFRRENVYLLGADDASELAALTTYLYKHGGASSIEQVDDVATGYAVFRVVLAEGESNG